MPTWTRRQLGRKGRGIRTEWTMEKMIRMHKRRRSGEMTCGGLNELDVGSSA